MKIYTTLFFKLLFHKWCVLRAGLWTKAPIWRLITHDLSKFYPSEFPHYARRFVGGQVDEDGYLGCWIRHQNRNPHHWEFWVSRPKSSWLNLPEINWQPAPMPMWAVREMLADWMGASRTYSGFWPDPHNWEWLDNNYSEMILHYTTKKRINTVVDELRRIKSLRRT